MGLTKRYLEEQDDQEYSLSEEDLDLVVCFGCLVDHSLFESLNTDLLANEKCSFCDKVTDVVSIENFFDEIVEAIHGDGWVRAVDNGSYDSSEGGYLQPTTERREIARELCEEVGIENIKLLDIIENSFDDVWMIDKPYGPDYLDDMFSLNWDKFKKNIIHKKRFTTFMNPNKKEVQIFSHLMDHLKEHYVTELNIDQTLYRGRAFNTTSPLSDTNE